MKLLENKNVLVGVTGSISVYKSLELIRLYIKAGANVKVIMTASAKKFITPLTFETISQAKILDDENECWEKESVYNHIAITKWADIFVIAPLSANSLNKFANGIADNILSQAFLANTKPSLFALAANTNMVLNDISLKSVEKLKSLGHKFVDPVSKELACRDIGTGALADVEEIFSQTCKELYKDDYWINRDAILSGGGTVEKIDDIRYISNFSSGKMAASMAKALYYLGANVKLIASRGYEVLPKEIEVFKVQSSQELYESLHAQISISSRNKKKPYLFMIAAVSDYIPNEKYDGKLKKSIIGKSWDLELKQNIDVLSILDKKDIFAIGFKAETNEDVALQNAQNMLNEKNLDAVCLNLINEENSFGSDSNNIDLVFKDRTLQFCGEKLQISLEIAKEFEKEDYGK